MPEEPTPVPDLQLLKRRLGGYVAQGNHEAAARVRRELEAAKLEMRVREIVDAAPPPSPELLDRLRTLLAPAADGGAADAA
ncbi:hypothetical protein [Streptomyces sp. MZ04]|uniref:hypothetical protein n=1 Tax=Streptomyces sp. MZ04 TaxID=2559236 RepID=UPI00107E927C|nr:hypothetical protein [Streptomyces sp. MZ04]TGB12616.1 hypothetical protein E2651_11570 [Streptomyces sp. MZ04]